MSNTFQFVRQLCVLYSGSWSASLVRCSRGIPPQVPAGAKAGVIAPIDVKLPAGATGLDPSQTNFFQTLNIPTKIVKGSIELTTEQTVCQQGKKITASQAVCRP